MKYVVICSGGLDSTVLFHYLARKGHSLLALNFSYGSKHNTIERECAERLIPNLMKIDIDLSNFKSALLVSGGDVPHGHYEDETMKDTVVPFRNGIMLAYAVGLADSEAYDTVALGSHSGDHAIYPDCRPEFTEAFSRAATKGTHQEVRVEAPFGDLSKGEIVEIGLDCGFVDLMMGTWSCYEGDTVHCGQCGACTERREAFTYAGVEDTTEYRFSG